MWNEPVTGGIRLGNFVDTENRLGRGMGAGEVLFFGYTVSGLQVLKMDGTTM